jgi:hypothetical protein
MKFRGSGDYDKILRREMKLPELPPPDAAAPQEAAPATNSLASAASGLSASLSNMKIGNPFKKS